MLEHVKLAQEAQAVGLIVTRLSPMDCGGNTEYLITFWQPNGDLWAEGSHETAEQIRALHIDGYRSYKKKAQT